MSGNYEGLDMHTKGIKHVVALRGGVDRLGNIASPKPVTKLRHLTMLKGFDGFLKTITIA
jgi:hypothetical protein